MLILYDHGMGWPGGWSDPAPGGRGDPSVALSAQLGDELYLMEMDAALEEIRARTYARSFTSVFGRDVQPSYIDLGNFAQLLKRESSSGSVAQAADRVTIPWPITTLAVPSSQGQAPLARTLAISSSSWGAMIGSRTPSSWLTWITWRALRLARLTVCNAVEV